VTLDEVAQGGVLEELAAATSAVVHVARATAERGHLLATIGAFEESALRDRLEAEVAPASGAVGGVWRVHVEAAGTSHGRHWRAAMSAEARAFGYPRAA
jgi:hypothetical protein